ncbi:hypothetical protein M758_5G151800 [Ceratodon purpureus]|nr:hypothetical protein M758_5G151800 [Ceratodon purpureus]
MSSIPSAVPVLFLFPSFLGHPAAVSKNCNTGFYHVVCTQTLYPYSLILS